MNEILNEIRRLIRESRTMYLPHVKAEALEENGAVYYMYGKNGTEFDWYVNGKVSDFFVFYKDENNLRNYISYIETGISDYRQFKVDTPHYHRTTGEHYYILEGAQKIIDIDNEKEIEVKEGDFVFIPAGTKHWTKNKKGTKVFFSKAPEGRDKIMIDESDVQAKLNFNMRKWKRDYETNCIIDEEDW